LNAAFGDKIHVEEPRLIRANLLFEQYVQINTLLKKYEYSREKVAKELNMTPRQLSILITTLRKSSVAYRFPDLPSWFPLEDGLLWATAPQFDEQRRRRVEKGVNRDSQKILFNNGRKKPMTKEGIEAARARQRAILEDRIKRFTSRKSTILELTQKTPANQIPSLTPNHGAPAENQVPSSVSEHTATLETQSIKSPTSANSSAEEQSPRSSLESNQAESGTRVEASEEASSAVSATTSALKSE